jgi:hypothetical protein
MFQAKLAPAEVKLDILAVTFDRYPRSLRVI